MIVLILVAVLWIAVLVPSVISKLSERRSAGSIDHFHQRLNLLQRTGPKLVEPAYRLTGTESAASSTGPVVAAVPPPLARPNLILVPPVDDASLSSAMLPDELAQPSAVDEVVVRLHLPPPIATESDLSALSVADQRRLVARDRRQLARKRRRDVFGTLCALAALTGVLGLVHPLRGAWILSAVFLALLVAFLGLAVYGQHVEAERRQSEHLLRTQLARNTDDDVDSGAIKYLSEDELAHYYEAQDALLAAEA